MVDKELKQRIHKFFKCLLFFELTTLTREKIETNMRQYHKFKASMSKVNSKNFEQKDEEIVQDRKGNNLSKSFY